MYASDIVINDDRREPVPFALGEDLRLTDAEGTHMWVRIVRNHGPVGSPGVPFPPMSVHDGSSTRP